MKATTHALVGGLTGAIIGRPALAAIAGVASHALLDVLPHRDEDRLLHVIVDGCGALAVLVFAAAAGNIGMVAGVIGGVIPDLENVPDVLFKRKVRKLFPSHWWEHERAAGGRGAGIETAVLFAAVVGLVAVFHRTVTAGMLK
jgi:hypothetical protein